MEKMTECTIVSENDCKNILDSFKSMAIYVTAAEDHRLLYMNKNVLGVTPHAKVGMICHEVWEGFCNNCPINSIGDNDFVRTLNYNCPVADVAEVSATRILWQGKIPAYIICVVPRIADSQCETEDNMLNNIQMSSFYTINDSYEIVACSNSAEELFPQLLLEKKCYECLYGNNQPCDNCPIDVKSGNDFSRAIPCKLIDGKDGHIIALYNTSSREEKDSEPGEIGYLNSVGDEKHRDVVTRGYNRQGFIYTVENIRKNNTDLTNYAMVFVNIKGFKAINDVLGHEAGDNLLRVLFMKYQTSGLRPKVSSRNQSDHFVFLVEKKYLNLDVLSKLLEFKWVYGRQQLSIHCQSGIYPIDDCNIEIYEAIDRAKIAMEHISNEPGRGYCVFDNNMQSDYVARAEILGKYKEALQNGDFKIYYQPIVDASNGKIVSAEALIRWIDEEGRIISPAVFIPVLEDAGQISKIDFYVAKSVRNFYKDRYEKNLPIVPISVNLSRMDLYDPSLRNELILVIEQGEELPKDSVRYEITETAFVSQIENKMEILDDLRRMGRKIMLDDFGSGYSSFNMLNRFDFDFLKIDMELIRQIETDNKAKSIIGMLIGLCHELEIQVIAEGVETKKELEFLQSKGCDFIQGYYFSKPLDEECFIAYLEEKL